MDFVEICNIYVGKMIIEAAKRIFNSDKICRSYSDLNLGVTFLEHSVLATVSLHKLKSTFGTYDTLFVLAMTDFRTKA